MPFAFAKSSRKGLGGTFMTLASWMHASLKNMDLISLCVWLRDFCSAPPSRAVRKLALCRVSTGVVCIRSHSLNLSSHFLLASFKLKSQNTNRLGTFHHPQAGGALARDPGAPALPDS